THPALPALSPHTPQSDRPPFELRIGLRKLANLQELVLSYFAEALESVAGGPPALDLLDKRRSPQTDVQLHRIGPEGTATPDGPMNRARFDVARPSNVLHGKRDSRANCGAIGFHAD